TIHTENNTLSLHDALPISFQGETIDIEIDVQNPVHAGLKGQWAVTCFPFGKSDVGIVVDEITEHKRMAEAIHQVEHQLELALAKIGRSTRLNSSHEWISYA